MKKLFKSCFGALLFTVCIFHSLFADSKNIVYSNTFDFSTIDSLNISLTYENLKVSRIYGDEIIVEIGSNNIKKIPDVIIQEETLIIQSKEQKVVRGNKCTVYIYLPQDFNAQSIELHNVSGNISADILQAQNAVLISNVSGRTDINTCKTELFTVTSVSGNNTLQKITADYFELSATSGHIFAELEQAPLASSMISNISGKTQLYYPKDSNLEIIAFSIAGTNYHKSIGTDGPQLSITSVSGKIEVVEY